MAATQTRLLRTTVGGFTVINLDGALLATFFKKENLNAQVDGVRTVFTTGSPYVAGHLEVFLGPALQNYVSGYVTESDPGSGEFTLSVAPTSDPEQPLWVKYLAA